MPAIVRIVARAPGEAAGGVARHVLADRSAQPWGMNVALFECSLYRIRHRRRSRRPPHQK